MTSAASNHYVDTPSFIHQRYQDTAYNIFQQQQKLRQDEKRREKQQQHSNFAARLKPSGVTAYPPPELGNYGNKGTVGVNNGALSKVSDKKQSSPTHKLSSPKSEQNQGTPNVKTEQSRGQPNVKTEQHQGQPSVKTDQHRGQPNVKSSSEPHVHHRPRKKHRDKPVVSLETNV